MNSGWIKESLAIQPEKRVAYVFTDIASLKERVLEMITKYGIAEAEKQRKE